MNTLTLPMSHPGERINYLHLALEARSAIKRLKTLLHAKERAPELNATLGAAIHSLKAVNPPKSLYSKLYDPTGYSRFEEIHTLHEVSRLLDNAGIEARLQKILSGEEFGEEDLRTAIRFFSAVENRALYHYNDPSLAENST